MDAQAIVDDYVNKVAAHLPRTLRNDIGLELRTLLTEQLASAAQDAARVPDSALAMDVLRRFGSPHDVAARYAPRGFQLIEPGPSPLVVTLAVLCIAVQWAVTLPAVFSSRMTVGDWWLQWGLSAFAWAGVLVLWFALASWVQRRSPADPYSGGRPWTHWIFWVPFPRAWRPGEPEAAERRAAVGAAPLGAVLTVFFIAPAWILSRLLPAGTDTSWALYDDQFQRWLLVPLIALMAVRLVLLAAAALNERWDTRTETLRVGLWICFVGLLYWAVFEGRIFASPATDALFKAWVLVFLLVNTIQLLVWMRRVATRVRMPEALRR